MNAQRISYSTTGLEPPLSQHEQLALQKISVTAKNDKLGFRKETEYNKFLVNIPFIQTLITAKFEEGVYSTISSKNESEPLPTAILKISDIRDSNSQYVIFERKFYGSKFANAPEKFIKAMENASNEPKSSLRTILEFISPQLVAELKESKRDKKYIPGLETASDILENIRLRLKIIYPESHDNAD